MKDKVFVDTNILVYAHDTSSGLKFQRARKIVEELWTSGLGVISTQVLQELCINLRKRPLRPIGVAEVRRIIEDFLKWELVTNSPTSVLAALDVETRYKLSFWDALIVQAAESAGAMLLYSEDFSHGQRYGTVRVLNPFV